MATALEDFKADGDWQNAFGAKHRGPIENVTRVIYAAEGENDEDDWLAVVEWSGDEGRFAVMSAGCDYTGWDCQASGTIEFYPSEATALSDLTPEQAKRLGLPHDADKP
jgi:hypothetical protein